MALLDGLFGVGAGLLGLALGLWWGERGRRQAAERLLVHGTTQVAAPRRLGSPVASEEVATTTGRAFTEATVERGVERLLAEAEAEGQRLSPEEAREQVVYMLSQLGPGGLEDDEPP